MNVLTLVSAIAYKVSHNLSSNTSDFFDNIEFDYFVGWAAHFFFFFFLL